ncbi:MAG: Glu-tRNA(Gln) amidotransferase subunit GatD [Candidatus Aenigmarchaeota archaeon]|nr:Glu-tRNA(Gln) amidotransferase subunit GatD [Candidatus Aenigmarchaeota archaeon]
MESNYSEKIQKIFKNENIDVGSMIQIISNGQAFEGLLMPRVSGDKNSIILKLKNGYNIGIEFNSSAKIKRLEEKSVDLGKFEKKKLEHDPKKPTILILHTGGTVASKVDYRTGGVVASFEPKELISLFPELQNIANIRSKLIRKMFSEDMRFEHFQILAREVAEECHNVDGIIIAHGTDTLHYSSAALAFMIENLPIPVMMIGSQRSSDRASADAGMNIICAAKFITETDFAGVAICMHGSSNDTYCNIFNPCKTRKMHTSRRDAFQSINDMPYARVWYKEDKIEFLKKDYLRKDKNRTIILKDGFENKVGLLKVYPGFDLGILKYFEKSKYKGLVLEGTGLGHAPINEIDEFTKINKDTLNTIKKLTKNGCVVVMASQTIYGRVGMNVYSTGRDLQEAGVIPGEDMHPETAYAKLKWLLGNFSKEETKKMIAKNLRGEINERSEPRTFPPSI